MKRNFAVGDCDDSELTIEIVSFFIEPGGSVSGRIYGLPRNRRLHVGGLSVVTS